MTDSKTDAPRTDANGFPVVERPVKDESKGKDENKRKDESRPLPRFG